MNRRRDRSLALLTAICLLVATGCAVTVEDGRRAIEPASEPATLPSWNEGTAKSAIVDFVERVTREGGPDYVAPADRVATFDNDGTLWAEKPFYFQFAFVYDRIRAIAPQHSDWADTEPFKTVVESTAVFPAGISTDQLGALIEAGMAGTTQAEYHDEVMRFFATARHPELDRPYQELVYQPMLELLDYLRAHDFEIHIVSGGGVEFIRGYAEEVYGIPPQNVIGTSLAYQFRDGADAPEIFRQPTIAVFNDRAVKPSSIQLHIGKRPILAFGNSDGDIEMLEFATIGRSPAIGLLLHHDDAEREYAYDTGTEQALQDAAANGWTVVSIRDDFATVFPPER